MYILHIPIIFILINKLESIYNNNIQDGKNKRDIIDNIIGIYHSVYVTILSFMYLSGYISMRIYDYVLLHSIVYNFNDGLKQIKYNKKLKNEMLLHHFILILSIVFKKIVYFETTYTYYLSINFLTEISTPTLNLSQILYYMNRSNTILFKICTVITFILYFLFRIVLLTYILIDELYNDDIKNKYLCIVQLSLLLLNSFWFNKITRLIIKHNNF
jgi:hypothetical protein